MKITTLISLALLGSPLAAFAAEPETEAVEFYNKQLNHYFVTATASEAKNIDDGGAGPGWVRTGRSFQAWLNAASAPPDAAGVCRFYSTAANSHFYTASAQECQLLKDQEAAERRSTGTVRGWSYEGIAFQIQPPVNGQCPAGTMPFSRVYNNGFTSGEGSNHRFVDDSTLRDLMVDRSWVAEGVVLCAVTKSTGTSANLPPTTTNFSSLAATWSGSAKWETKVANQRAQVTAPLQLVITDAGAVSGSGNGCAFTGQVQSGDGFRSLFAGAISASGCSNASFNGAYTRFQLERYDLGTLNVHLKRGDGANEASIEALLSAPAAPVTPVANPGNFSSISGDWTGTVGWLITVRQGATETTAVASNRPLSLSISATGALSGSGMGCTWSGSLQLSDAASARFGGSVQASGCPETRFNGAYTSVSLHREDGGHLDVEFEKETEANNVRTKARVAGVIDAAGAVTPVVPTPPAPAAGVTGTFQGAATFLVTQRPRSGGGNETTLLSSTQTLRITIAGNGDVSGTGFGCSFSGNVQLTDTANQRFTGTLTAAGCSDARFSGSYAGAVIHPEDGNTVSVEMEREVEDSTTRTKMRITARAARA
jgi:heat shock protein HslJ